MHRISQPAGIEGRHDADTASNVVSAGKRRARLARWLRRTLLVLAVVCVVFATATARVLVWPVQRTTASASAIVMLAGPGDRLQIAVQLAREHKAPVLVVSRGWLGYGGPCPAPIPGIRTICFDPDPGNTRGEAEYIGRIAKREGWRSVIVVATRPQAARAQLLVGRCFGGQVYLATAPIPAGSWPYQIAYGWGALFKAVFLVRSC